MGTDVGPWRVGRADWLAMLALVVPFCMWLAPLPAPISLLGGLVTLGAVVWRLELAAALAPLTFPFTFVPKTLGTLQIAPAEAAVGLLVAGLLGRLVLDASRGRLKSGILAPPMTPPAWLWLPALSLLVVATISLFTVADTRYIQQSLVEYRKVIVQPLLFAAVAWLALRRPRDLWLALIALGVAGAVVGLHAASEVVLGLTGVSVEGVRRAIGVYQHPNNLALFTGRCVALGVTLWIAWPRAAGRWLALALAAGAGVGLLASFSRGGWFAALATVAIVALLLGHRRLGAMLAVGAAALVVILPRTGVERLNRLLDSEGGSAALRLDLWRSTVAMLADHPLTGVGLDQFLYQYNPRYVAPEAWAERFTAHPHNLALDFWARLGLAGLAVGVALMGLTAAAAFRLTRRLTGELRALAAGAGAIVLYGLLHGLVDNGFFLPDLALVFWLAAVVLGRLDRLPTADKPGTIQTHGQHASPTPSPH